jgi:hypothetical protein
MGIADRDYMRERQNHRAGPFSPPEPSAGMTIWMVLLFVVLTYAAYRTWQFWQPKLPTAVVKTVPVEAAAESQKPIAHPSLTGNWDPNRIVERPAPAAQSTTAVHVVTKCVVNGVTLYAESAEDCAAHAKKLLPVRIDPTQNLVDGLPPDVPQAPIPPPAQAVQAGPVPSLSPAADPNVIKKAQCLDYEEEIKWIDARARQPLSAWEQDQLAAKRKRARDEQFRLRC